MATAAEKREAMKSVKAAFAALASIDTQREELDQLETQSWQEIHTGSMLAYGKAVKFATKDGREVTPIKKVTPANEEKGTPEIVQYFPRWHREGKSIKAF